MGKVSHFYVRDKRTHTFYMKPEQEIERDSKIFLTVQLTWQLSLAVHLIDLGINPALPIISSYIGLTRE